MKRYLVAALFLMCWAPLGFAQETTIPAVTQNTVTTSGPVKSETTISVGTLAGQVLMWLAAAFSVPVGGLMTAYLMRLLKLAGVQITQQMSDQLNRVIVNGLNHGAANATTELSGKASIEVKNKIVASAVDYTQRHAADTITALGLDPNSGAAVEAIKARIQTAINDPYVPTSPKLDSERSTN